MGNLLAWFRDAFWSKEMELSVVGLSNAGKSTLCAAFAIGSGYAMDDMIPTVGFNMRQVKRNNVTMKIWDLGGQSRFKSLWERYCKGVTAIVYVVDASNLEQIDASKAELHELIAKPSLEGIPLLILGNKCDVDGALSVEAIKTRLAVETITGRPLVTCMSVSAKVGTGLEECLEWLCNRADEAKK